MQSTMIRGRLEAARREAQQAQATVQDLRAQVEAAETESQKRQEKVRNLSGQTRQADPTYSARQRAASTTVPVKTQQFIVGLFDATSDQRVASGVSLKADPDANPVINSQGQTTGRIVNVSA